jgi:hypothetical protein
MIVLNVCYGFSKQMQRRLFFRVCYPLIFMLYNFPAFVTVFLSQSICVGKCNLFAVFYKITSTTKLPVLWQNIGV